MTSGPQGLLSLLSPATLHPTVRSDAKWDSPAVIPKARDCPGSRLCSPDDNTDRQAQSQKGCRFWLLFQTSARCLGFLHTHPLTHLRAGPAPGGTADTALTGTLHPVEPGNHSPSCISCYAHRFNHNINSAHCVPGLMLASRVWW